MDHQAAEGDNIEAILVGSPVNFTDQVLSNAALSVAKSLAMLMDPTLSPTELNFFKTTCGRGNPALSAPCSVIYKPPSHPATDCKRGLSPAIRH